MKLIIALIICVLLFAVYKMGYTDGYKRRSEQIESSIIKHWVDKYDITEIEVSE